MNEIFKDIPGYEGFYQVSNLGRVKSVERIQFKNYTDRISHYVVIKEKFLTPCKDKMGYTHVRLRKANKYVLWKIHQLVAFAFLNHDRKDIANIVHHINGIKNDNRLNNLKVINRAEHRKYHSQLKRAMKALKGI